MNEEYPWSRHFIITKTINESMSEEYPNDQESCPFLLRKTIFMEERENYEDYQWVSKSALLPRIIGLSEVNYVESFTHYLHTVFYESSDVTLLNVQSAAIRDH
jgi:hypothetical protein